MGRLSGLRKAKKYIMAAAICLALIIYGFILKPSVEKSALHNYLASNNLVVGSQLVDGIGQIYYEFNDKRVYVTNDKMNHFAPKSSGQYIVWQDEANGQSQVVLYNLLDNSKLRLSMLASNTNISLDANKVAWEAQRDGKTVIYYFDGYNVEQISGQHPAIRPQVKGEKVLYAQQLSNKQWEAVEYDRSSGESMVTTKGEADEAAWPRYENGRIKTGIEGSARYYY